MSEAVRKEGFYTRGPEGEVGCIECGWIFSLPDAWMDARIGDSYPCPHCGLSNRIPTPEEVMHPVFKHPMDSVFLIPVPEREAPLVLNPPVPVQLSPE